MAEIEKTKPRTAAEIERMKVLYEGGCSLAEVGAEFGVTASRVEQIFRRNHIKTRKKTVSEKFRRAMTDRRTVLSEDALIKLYTKENLSIAKTAEKLNVGIHAVRRNLQDYGIPIRPIENYTRSRLTAELLKTLYLEKNLTAAEIADRLGYSPLTIGKKLSKFGIKKRLAARHHLSPLPVESNTSQRSDELPVKTENGGSDLTVPSPALTVQEIVEKYGLHDKTVRGLIGNGVFPNAYREINGKIHRWRVPAADLENFSPQRKGRERIAAPSAATILHRSQRAKQRIKDSHGYGKKEIREMVELENQGLMREEIAVRYRLDEKIVADLLDRAALLKPRPQKKSPAKKELKRIPEEILIELYVEGKFSTAYILEQLNTNYASLYINLRHYGIPLRGEHFRRSAQEREQELYQMFIEEKLTAEAIADRLSLTESYVKRKINELRHRLKTPLSPD